MYVYVCICIHIYIEQNFCKPELQKRLILLSNSQFFGCLARSRCTCLDQLQVNRQQRLVKIVAGSVCAPMHAVLFMAL